MASKIELVSKTFTCPVCGTKVPVIPDGKLRLCDCKKMGIDSDKGYVRVVGHVPVEDPSFSKWYERFEPTIKVLKAQYQAAKAK